MFLITDEDNPHSGPGKDRLSTAARTTLVVCFAHSIIKLCLTDHKDLVQAGIVVEPFFISTDDKPFDVSKFYSVSFTMSRNVRV